MNVPLFFTDKVFCLKRAFFLSSVSSYFLLFVLSSLSDIHFL